MIDDDNDGQMIVGDLGGLKLLHICLRPGADQSSKAVFGKSAFAKTCSNVLSFVKDMTGAHQSSKKQKYFRARFGTCNEQNAFC